jgi:hypothetical protein
MPTDLGMTQNAQGVAAAGRTHVVAMEGDRRRGAGPLPDSEVDFKLPTARRRRRRTPRDAAAEPGL